MLSPTLDTIRLFIHVLAAAIWVGGQFTLAGAVPGLRKVGPEATKAAANGFAKVAWPAYFLVIVTGMWNIFATDADTSGSYMVVLGLKFMLVVAAGVSAAVHSVASNRAAMAITGALGGVLSLVIMFLGVLLMNHG